MDAQIGNKIKDFFEDALLETGIKEHPFSALTHARWDQHPKLADPESIARYVEKNFSSILRIIKNEDPDATPAEILNRLDYHFGHRNCCIGRIPIRDSNGRTVAEKYLDEVLAKQLGPELELVKMATMHYRSWPSAQHTLEKLQAEDSNQELAILNIAHIYIGRASRYRGPNVMQINGYVVVPQLVAERLAEVLKDLSPNHLSRLGIPPIIPNGGAVAASEVRARLAVNREQA